MKTEQELVLIGTTHDEMAKYNGQLCKFIPKDSICLIEFLDKVFILSEENVHSSKVESLYKPSLRIFTFCTDDDVYYFGVPKSKNKGE